MRRRKVDGSSQRQLLAALITSREFLGQAAGAIEEDLGFLGDAPLFRLVAEWCLAYWGEYRDAPGKRLESIYYSWRDKEEDEELSDAVHELLSGLSEDWAAAAEEATNVPFLLDQLSAFLKRCRLERLRDSVESLLSQGDVSAADEEVQSYRSVELGGSTGCDPLNDLSVWDRAFAEPAKPLVEFYDDFGKFFGSSLSRDSFVAVQAPEKRGKSFILMDLAVHFLRSMRKVAVFQVGDLSETQWSLRLAARLAEMPIEGRDRKHRVPTRLVKDEGEPTGWEVSYKTVKRPVLTKGRALEAIEGLKTAIGAPLQARLQQSIHASGSISVHGIDSILDRWHTEKGFDADLIVIDYADILAPEKERKDEQQMIDERWMALRRLSQERHCLVLTATQAAATSYTARTQSMRDFSRDKRKYAHVTGVIGLNQTEDEKEAQLMRLNWIVLRGSGYVTKRCLTVGQCLQVGRAYTCASF